MSGRGRRAGPVLLSTTEGVEERPTHLHDGLALDAVIELEQEFDGFASSTLSYRRVFEEEVVADVGCRDSTGIEDGERADACTLSLLDLL